MSIRYISSLKFSLVASVVLAAGCSSSRQIAIDYPSATQASDAKSGQIVTKAHQFQPLPGFQVIDGDDYYVQLISEFDFKGDALKNDCSNMTPSYGKGDLSSALIFTVHNDILKFKNEAAGFLYQATPGKCKFKFDAKKITLTPWMRLDAGKETLVDYNFYSSATSDVDVSALVSDVTAASNLLAFTGVGMGVAIVGQFAGQWAKNSPSVTATTPAPVKNSSESHSLPAIVTFSGKTGTLNQTVFKVYAVAEGGINLFGPDAQPIGELRVYPEIIPSLLLKTAANGIPDARDLTLEELGYLPIKSATGEIKLLQLIEQSKHPAKPNLKPNWSNYEEVENNCRKIKLVMKDLGFNKFDRNAFIYYFLANSKDWKNYNISPQKAMSGEIRLKTMESYHRKDFSLCLAVDDYAVMKAMGLPVNLPSDWKQFEESSQKKEQFFTPLKSIERQLVSVLKNPTKTEMEQQLFPLLATDKNGEGTVLLQNHLGDFGLEKLLAPPSTEAGSVPRPSPAVPSLSAANGIPVDAAAPTLHPVASMPTPIPGEGVIISAHQLAQVFSGLSIKELSCARNLPDQLGKPAANVGILLFTTKEGSPRAKGGAMEFEFSGGKIIRIAFQLPSYRDFEQNVLDHPDVGGCRIEPSFLNNVH